MNTNKLYIAVPILACQDRLLRVLKDSGCSFEVEVCGIPSIMQVVPKNISSTTINPRSLEANESNEETKFPKQEDVYVCYGTLDGKIAMVTFRFPSKNQLEPIHTWEVPVNAIKQPITCLTFSTSKPEFYVSRSDGSIEVL